MWTEHTEYHKLQLCTVFRYQHNNTLCKISSNYRYRKKSPKISFFFNIAHPYFAPLMFHCVSLVNPDSICLAPAESLPKHKLFVNPQVNMTFTLQIHHSSTTQSFPMKAN